MQQFSLAALISQLSREMHRFLFTPEACRLQIMEGHLPHVARAILVLSQESFTCIKEEAVNTY